MDPKAYFQTDSTGKKVNPYAGTYPTAKKAESTGTAFRVEFPEGVNEAEFVALVKKLGGTVTRRSSI